MSKKHRPVNSGDCLGQLIGPSKMFDELQKSLSGLQGIQSEAAKNLEAALGGLQGNRSALSKSMEAALGGLQGNQSALSMNMEAVLGQMQVNRSALAQSLGVAMGGPSSQDSALLRNLDAAIGTSWDFPSSNFKPQFQTGFLQAPFFGATSSERAKEHTYKVRRAKVQRSRDVNSSSPEGLVVKKGTNSNDGTNDPSLAKKDIPADFQEITPRERTRRDWVLALFRRGYFRNFARSDKERMGRIHRPPGYLLGFISEVVFSTHTREHVILPILADMQKEYCEALAERRTVKRIFVRLRGYWSFASAVGLFSFLKLVSDLWRKVSHL